MLNAAFYGFLQAEICLSRHISYMTLKETRALDANNGAGIQTGCEISP